MRLFTVPSLYFQVLGIGFSRFQDIADLRIAPMGQLRRFGSNKQNQKIDGSDFG